MSTAPPDATGLAHTLDLGRTLDGLDIALVCGSGGVGKTSVAAAIAASEARRGRKVCVLTIDPARRRADAMGLHQLDDSVRRVSLPGTVAKGGTLHALMLDPKHAFDRLVEETARSQAQRERILGNRIYQQISQHAVGMQEYMAIERLYELDRSQRFDLIVVDTPPAAHARDLLEAPQTMLRFLEGRSLRWFLKPGMKAGKLGVRALGGPGGMLMNLLSRITGMDMIRDATEFFEAFDGTYKAIGERVRVVERLLADDRCGFFVVTSPERESIDEAAAFWELLADDDYNFSGAIVNRVEPGSEPLIQTAAAMKAFGIDADLARALRAVTADHGQLASRDAGRIAELQTMIDDAPVLALPRLPRLVSDLTGLDELRPYLYRPA